MISVDVQMLAEQKRIQRKQGRAARNALSPEQRTAFSGAICRRVLELEAFRRAERVMIYAAFGAEADLTALTGLAPEKQYYYPVCLPDCQMAAARPLGPEGWSVGEFGIRTPIPERSQVLPPEQLDLVLVPCTSFDRQCRRVGMGKGYYDRFLPRCVNAVSVGIAFDCQRTDQAAADEFDWPLDAYVTEKRLYVGKGGILTAELSE